MSDPQDESITLLQNGDEIFPAMLEAITGARETVCFETFIYWSGSIADKFADALSAKAREGVSVHVLLDWVGCLRMDEALVDQMKEAGVEVEYFRPLRWFNLRRTNHRTHRKILIVDGRTGFTGGVGVADEWSGHAQDPSHWRDNHYRLTGSVVGEMQRAFFINWSTVRQWAPLPDNPAYYPKLENASTMETVTGAPWHERTRIHTLFLKAVEEATESIKIGTAYFMPGEKLLKALLDARKRGIDITVLMCGPHIDKSIVRQASRAHWGQLLSAGVRLFEYQPTLYHVKLLLIDDAWISVGSANFDARSSWLNDELNINVTDSEVVAQHSELFREDLSRATEITFSDWKRRPFLKKLKDWISQIFRGQL